MRRKMKLYSTRGIQQPSHLQKESCMSFQICIKTDKSLQQLATEICNLFSLPPFRQISFADHELDTDTMEYTLQPYYAQLLSFQLGLDTAYHEKQKTERAWKIRYRYCHKNPKWNDSILFGEPGWEPAVIQMPPSPWRSMHPVF